MRLAVIPARGGSKRIPRKNIRLFCGKPIIAWSIEAALKSECFDKIIVSTDDEKITEIARQYGAEVPFYRPLELSNDYIGTIPVVHHAIDWFGKLDIIFDEVCCIYATAPFLTPQDIQEGLRLLLSNDCDYVFSVTRFQFPIQRAIKINDTGRVEMFQPEHFNTRSQDLEEAYHDAGQFYWGIEEAWKEERIVFSNRAIPYILPHYRVQDIDTFEDWVRAEQLFKIIQQKE